jgi:hypothetical protein
VVLSTVIGGGGYGAVCRNCYDESGSVLGADCN